MDRFQSFSDAVNEMLLCAQLFLTAVQEADSKSPGRISDRDGYDRAHRSAEIEREQLVDRYADGLGDLDASIYQQLSRLGTHLVDVLFFGNGIVSDSAWAKLKEYNRILQDETEARLKRI